jgi:hypothetical protein
MADRRRAVHATPIRAGRFTGTAGQRRDRGTIRITAQPRGPSGDASTITARPR